MLAKLRSWGRVQLMKLEAIYPIPPESGVPSIRVRPDTEAGHFIGLIPGGGASSRFAEIPFISLEDARKIIRGSKKVTSEHVLTVEGSNRIEFPRGVLLSEHKGAGLLRYLFEINPVPGEKSKKKYRG